MSSAYWFDVKKKLPDEGARVLLYLGLDHSIRMTTGHLYVVPDYGEQEDDTYKGGDTLWMTDKWGAVGINRATHWAELPPGPTK
jgi:hypothetical protein